MTGEPTEGPIRAWPLSDVGGPEWTAAKVAELEAERAERIAELKRAIRRRTTADRKMTRLHRAVAELDALIWRLRFEAGR